VEVHATEALVRLLASIATMGCEGRRESQSGGGSSETGSGESHQGGGVVRRFQAAVSGTDGPMKVLSPMSEQDGSHPYIACLVRLLKVCHSSHQDSAFGRQAASNELQVDLELPFRNPYPARGFAAQPQVQGLACGLNSDAGKDDASVTSIRCEKTLISAYVCHWMFPRCLSGQVVRRSSIYHGTKRMEGGHSSSLPGDVPR
jgi:hypothetical protein